MHRQIKINDDLADIYAVNDFIAASIEKFFNVFKGGVFVEAHNEFITIIFMTTSDKAVDIDSIVSENLCNVRHDADFVINFKRQACFAAN